MGNTEEKREAFFRELEWPLDVLADSGLEFALKYKKKIYKRLMGYLDTAISENDLMVKVLSDYEVFCAFFIRMQITNPSTGVERVGAMYPSPAQSRLVELIENHKTVFALFSRQSGKSTTLSSYAIYYALRHSNAMLNLMATTEDQLEVMTDVYNFLHDIDYIRENFVGGTKSTLNKTKIKFGMNGSRINAKNLGGPQSNASNFKRGMRGTCFVDEWTLLKDTVIKEILQPLQANAYSKVRLIYTGTPKTGV